MNSDLYGVRGARTLFRLGVAHAAFWSAVVLVTMVTFSLDFSQQSSVLLALTLITGVGSACVRQFWDLLEDSIFRLGIGIWPLAYNKIKLGLTIQMILAAAVFAGSVISLMMSPNALTTRTLAVTFLVGTGLIWLLSVRNTFRFAAEVADHQDLVEDARELVGSLPASEDELARVNRSIDVFSGAEKGSPTPGQRGIRLIGLNTNNYHPNSGFDWIADFEKHYEEVRQEAYDIAAATPSAYENYAYPGVAPDNWKIIELYSDGRFSRNAKRCPKTMALLETIPGHPHYREVVFSRLDGGGQIKPHRDYSNLFLTLHLALDTPGNAWMKVGSEKIFWEEGKAVIFDTSFEHEVINESDKPRLVLIVDFPHPDLTDAELPFTELFR